MAEQYLTRRQRREAEERQAAREAYPTQPVASRSADFTALRQEGIVRSDTAKLPVAPSSTAHTDTPTASEQEGQPDAPYIQARKIRSPLEKIPRQPRRAPVSPPAGFRSQSAVTGAQSVARIQHAIAEVRAATADTTVTVDDQTHDEVDYSYLLRADDQVEYAELDEPPARPVSAYDVTNMTGVVLTERSPGVLPFVVLGGAAAIAIALIIVALILM